MKWLMGFITADWLRSRIPKSERWLSATLRAIYFKNSLPLRLADYDRYTFWNYIPFYNTAFYSIVFVSKFSSFYAFSLPDLSYSGSRLNTKMSFYQYRNFLYEDKAVSWPAYLYNEKLHTWKDSLSIERASKVIKLPNGWLPCMKHKLPC